MINQFRSRQFLLFLITGGLAAVVNFSSRILYNIWVSYSIAIIFAYITGMITAFILAKCFVFLESQRALHHSAIYFVLVNLVAVIQTWVISILLAFYALPAIGIRDLAPEIAHAVGIIVPVFSSYLGHKYLSFK